MAIQKLLHMLDLELLGDDLFRGENIDIGSKNVFGGQVLGQALAAAGRTVSGRLVHSLHAYFLRPGDTKAPMEYQVERVRNGRSFATRRVVALQHGLPVFEMMASFQVEEDGFEHQIEMPKVPTPEQLPTMTELRKQLSEMPPDKIRSWPAELPLDIRPIIPANPFSTDPHPPVQDLWFRTVEEVPDDAALHRCILAYASDFVLLRTASLPHGIWARQRNTQIASLDHAMWFHRDFRVDQWLLFSMQSPSASSSRGLASGNIFTADGKLVASASQEGLLRRLYN
jgi:acyl-CoA thioesterase-2